MLSRSFSIELVPMAAILRTVSDNMMNAQNTMRGLRMSMIVLRIRYEDLSSRYVDSSSFKDDIFRDPFWCPSLWTSDIKWAIFDHAHATKDMVYTFLLLIYTNGAISAILTNDVYR